jgi:D-alanyl-D-alanine carboxypeptidase
MKLIVAFLAVLIGVSQVAAAPALLVDADNGDVLFAQDATRSWHPASLTKLMTAHLALLAVQSGALHMDSTVVISANAAAAPPSASGIAAGHAIRLDEALRIMLVRSTNDIAIAVAETVRGNVTDFVAAMNAEAADLGMSGTRFRNPNGLDHDEQVTTARDMAVLVLAISRRHAAYADLFRIPFITLNGKQMPNTNELIGKYQGIDGMKTGYTCSSGWNLAASASQDGRRYISVVLGAKSKADRTTMTRALLDLGFSGKAPKIANLRNMKSNGIAEADDASVCGRHADPAKAVKPRQAAPQRRPAAVRITPDTSQKRDTASARRF